MAHQPIGAIKYGTRFGCRFGQPHDFEQIKDTKTAKFERCRICGVRKRWNKGYRGRVDNVAYLRDHVRQYAQPTGSTKRVFMKLHQPEDCVIKI